jgi:hypothetical protein
MPNVRRTSQQQLVRDDFKDFWHQVMQRLNRAENSTLFCKSLPALMGLTWMTQDVKLVKILLTAREGNLALDDKSAAELAFSGKMAELLNPVTHDLENPILIRHLKVLCGGLLVREAARHGKTAMTLLEEACQSKDTLKSDIRQRRRVPQRNDIASESDASTIQQPTPSSLRLTHATPATATQSSVNLFSAVGLDTVARTMTTQLQRSAQTAEVQQTASAPSLTTLSILSPSDPSQRVPRDDSTILPFRQDNVTEH